MPGCQSWSHSSAGTLATVEKVPTTKRGARRHGCFAVHFACLAATHRKPSTMTTKSVTLTTGCCASPGPRGTDAHSLPSA